MSAGRWASGASRSACSSSRRERSDRGRQRLCAGRRGSGRRARSCRDRRVRGGARQGAGRRPRHPRAGPLRRRAADARLRSRPHLPLHRRFPRRVRWRPAARRDALLQPARDPRHQCALGADGGRRALRGGYAPAPSGTQGRLRSASRASRATRPRRRGPGSIWRSIGRGSCSGPQRRARNWKASSRRRCAPERDTGELLRAAVKMRGRHRRAQTARRAARRQADARRPRRSRIPHPCDTARAPRRLFAEPRRPRSTC